MQGTPFHLNFTSFAGFGDKENEKFCTTHLCLTYSPLTYPKVLCTLQVVSVKKKCSWAFSLQVHQVVYGCTCFASHSHVLYRFAYFSSAGILYPPKRAIVVKALDTFTAISIQIWCCYLPPFRISGVITAKLLPPSRTFALAESFMLDAIPGTILFSTQAWEQHGRTPALLPLWLHKKDGVPLEKDWSSKWESICSHLWGIWSASLHFFNLLTGSVWICLKSSTSLRTFLLST